MKKTILIIFALLTSYLSCSQILVFPSRERSSFSLSFEPVSSIKEESINMTFELELESYWKYVKVSSQILPSLQGSYIDLAGGLGINLANKYEDIRYYSGIRLGFIFRGNQTYPLFGYESGINYELSEKIFIGLRATYDRREDFLFSGANPEYQFNGSIRIGYWINSKF